MGFVLTLVYITLTIIGPEQFGPEWASYHAFEYLAGITVLASLPSILAHRHPRVSIQIWLVLGFIVTITLSLVVNRDFAAAVESWHSFMSNVAVFFFIVANVNTIRRLKVLTLAVAAACMVVEVEALCGYYWGFRGATFVLRENLFSQYEEVIGTISRLRGVGFLNDPNDFAQTLLIALPLVYIAWRRGRIVTNSLLVIAPSALLLWGVYLTHSRGALIALAFLALMSSRKRLGTTASTVLAGTLIVAMMALDFTGGRGISAAEGADRIDAWASGLEMFKSAPLFGVGFGNFTSFNDITAHNSFVLCLAELGLVGSTLWVALIVTVTMSLARIIGRQEMRESPPGGQKAPQEAVNSVYPEIFSAFPLADDKVYSCGLETIPCCASEFRTKSDPIVPALVEGPISSGYVDYEEPAHFLVSATVSCRAFASMVTPNASNIETQLGSAYRQIVPKHWAMAMLLALLSFMTTSWFLSRTYSTTMWLVIGLATSTIALQRPAAESRDLGRWVFYTLGIETFAIILIYGIVRFAQ